MSAPAGTDAAKVITYKLSRIFRRTKDGYIRNLLKQSSTGFDYRYQEKTVGIEEYLPPEKRIKNWNYAIGDKVQVIRGETKDIGKVGYIRQISKASNMVEVPDVNMASEESFGISANLP